jgi:hypothetical protein
MENLFIKSSEIPFLHRQNWDHWLGTLIIIILCGLSLIWPWQSLIILFFGVTLLFFLIRPYAVLTLSIFLIAFECISLNFILWPTFEVGIPLHLSISAFGLLCWSYSRLAKVSPPFQSTTLDLPLFFLVVTIFPALLWTPYFGDGVRILIATAFCYALYLLIVALNNTFDDLKRLFWLCFALGILVVLTTISTFFFKITGEAAFHRFTDSFFITTFVKQFTGTRESLSGTMVGPKAVVTAIDLGIFCALTLFCTEERRTPRILLFLGLFILIFFHFLTISRLDTIGLFLGWLTFAYLNPQWRHKRIKAHLMMLSTVTAAILALLLFLNSFYTTKYFFARFGVQEQTVGYRFAGSQTRYDLYMDALMGLWNSGLMGRGAGGIMKDRIPTLQWLPDSASLYMSFLTDHGYGIFSFILMLWIALNIILGFKRALKNCQDQKHKIFIIGVISLFVLDGSPLSDMIFAIYIMWILLGLTAVSFKSVQYQNEIHRLP